MEAQVTSSDGFAGTVASTSRQPTPREVALSAYSFKSAAE